MKLTNWAYPVVGIVDTNSNPDGVDYIIPGNDDSIRAIKLYAASIADSILEGKDQASAITSKDEFVEVADAEAPAVEAPAAEEVVTAEAAPVTEEVVAKAEPVAEEVAAKEAPADTAAE